MIDPDEIRHARAARARDRCLQELRRHLGDSLPRPVVSAVQTLTDTLVRLSCIPDEQLEDTLH